MTMRRKINNLLSYEMRCGKRAMTNNNRRIMYRLCMKSWKLRRITTRNVLSGSFQFSLIVVVLKNIVR